MSSATVTEKKPKLTTSAMIASIASEGQRVKAAPFGKALVEYAASRPEVISRLRSAATSRVRIASSSGRYRVSPVGG